MDVDTSTSNRMGQVSQHPYLPASSQTLFAAKAKKKLSFEEISKQVVRNEVAVAAIFYGQAKASAEDIASLSKALDIPHELL